LAEARATAALPYGLTYTHADQVWALGVRGAGIVIGSQDTGVQWDHPALVEAYRGSDSAALTVTHAYNWLDAFGRDPFEDAGCGPDPQIPCDDQGHGTHTVGTLVGDATADGGTVLGMAPAAQWIGCRNMRGGVGTPASYTTCFEWFLAPYPQGGDPFSEGRPELAPDIVNNSWGCPPYEGCDAGALLQVTNLVRAAGIFVVASAGNDGWQGCSSITDPIAIYDSAFTTGAHDEQGSIAYFSSRGPVTVDGSGRLKPDITAPGVDTYSTYPGNTYTSLSGTSMAAPHVAGAVALLWSAAPALAGDIEATEDILIKSAVPVTSDSCGSDLSPMSPNNVYGYGRLDILAAVNLAREPFSPTVSLFLPWMPQQ
jgi:subtilisin family serine protease